MTIRIAALAGSLALAACGADLPSAGDSSSGSRGDDRSTGVEPDTSGTATAGDAADADTTAAPQPPRTSDSSTGDGSTGDTSLECVPQLPGPDIVAGWLGELSGSTQVLIDGESQTIDERGSAEGRDLARRWLVDRYSELGYAVLLHEYGTGANVIAERAGGDGSEVVVVGAHFDSVGNRGADDNGSGVVAGLALASALADCPLSHTLRFIAFDEEELGLLGAQAYVTQTRDIDEVTAMFNMETLGYDSDDDGAMLLVDCGEGTSAELTAEIEAAIDTLGLALQTGAACSPASDHGPFWQMGIPAVAVTEDFFGDAADANPCYHAPCDDVDQINFDYIDKITTAVLHVLAARVIAR